MKKLTYNLAPALPSEKEDTNLNRMNRWERANGMKLKELTDEEWVDVVASILCLTESEAQAYLESLRANQ
ncbi:hypothetical protein PvtlMGM2_2401 [Prevotella sp. MGM2]|nr:hypothetical protein PvtlMGM2_2401 [Prevotella sp. MGM2]